MFSEIEAIQVLKLTGLGLFVPFYIKKQLSNGQTPSSVVWIIVAAVVAIYGTLNQAIKSGLGTASFLEFIFSIVIIAFLVYKCGNYLTEKLVTRLKKKYPQTLSDYGSTSWFVICVVTTYSLLISFFVLADIYRPF